MLVLVSDEKLKWSKELANRLRLQVGENHRPFSLIYHPQHVIPLRSSSHGLCQPEHALWGLEPRHHNKNTTVEAADADMPLLPDTEAGNSCTHAGRAHTTHTLTDFDTRHFLQKACSNMACCMKVLFTLKS